MQYRRRRRWQWRWRRGSGQSLYLICHTFIIKFFRLKKIYIYKTIISALTALLNVFLLYCNCGSRRNPLRDICHSLHKIQKLENEKIFLKIVHTPSSSKSSSENMCGGLLTRCKSSKASLLVRSPEKNACCDRKKSVFVSLAYDNFYK